MIKKHFGVGANSINKYEFGILIVQWPISLFNSFQFFTFWNRFNFYIKIFSSSKKIWYRKEVSRFTIYGIFCLILWKHLVIWHLNVQSYNHEVLNPFSFSGSNKIKSYRHRFRTKAYVLLFYLSNKNCLSRRNNICCYIRDNGKINLRAIWDSGVFIIVSYAEYIEAVEIWTSLIFLFACLKLEHFLWFFWPKLHTVGCKWKDSLFCR